MKVLVTGAQGMVGRAVCDYCSTIGDEVLAYGRDGLDIADSDAVMTTVARERPDVIINCAAWTDVDGCESDRERAFAANATGPENLARASKLYDAGFVTISTDYVFDGSKTGFYTQEDQPNPQSVYAASKLEGEQRAQLANENTLVVRTGYVFGPGGRNFLSTVVERAREGATLHVINDQFGTPTYSRDLAIRLRELAERNYPGIYHVVNAGEGTTFADFAREALTISGISDVDLRTVSMDSLDRPAPRPRNSRMRCLLSEQLQLPPMPDWRTSLRQFIQDK
ncbi:MAG TPA: dTDP-4-dehydrorhamnose reductase [Pyrinomonadaceae bacterium]|nr:dTDP-4-dehydrorhamnose reductase [Pyrinomonadaceae bacterium]